MAQEQSVIDWMLEDSDPALRWRVERDLVHADPAVWQAARAQVAGDGFGARLLGLQDADGQWDGGAYFPGDFDWQGPEAQPGAGQPWTATTWSLNALREWGLDASALADTADRLAANSHWEYNNASYWLGEVDCCINGYTIANGAWLGADVSTLADWFVEHQQPEGGWNCEWEEGSTRSSVASTLNSLKGILAYEIVTGGSDELRAARKRAEEYLLQRRLMYRLSDGKLLGPWVTQFAYPFRWRYSALNALDYFRSANLHDGGDPDPRLAQAIEFVRAACQSDGTWLQEVRHPGRAWFEVDVPVGEPSKWLTFYATRVLDWWDAARA
jgi:hypothetical protein